MIDLQTILGSKVNTAFRVNGLWVPASSLSSTMPSYCDPAVFYYDGYTPQNFFISGTAFRLSFQGKKVAVCTAHQMELLEADPNQFAVFTESGKKMVTSSQMIVACDQSIDLRLFDFSEPSKKGMLDDVVWWKAKREELHDPVPAAVKVFCVGYPGDRNLIDYEQNFFKRQPTAVWGEMCTPGMSDRLAFKVSGSIVDDPDGMSGSPVFGITVDELQPKCFWAGIVANASSSVFNFVPASQVGAMINHLTSKQA